MNYKFEYPLIYGHGDSTVISVFGESIRKMLIKEGVSANKIEITGNPKFNQLLKYKNDNVQKLMRDKFHISHKKKVILILTQYLVESGAWTPEERKIFINEIAKSLLTLNNYVLILKLHPIFEKEKDYFEILKNLDLNFKIFKKEKTNEILSICDAAISVSSTTALEAIILEKPTLIINLFNEDSPLFFRDSGTPYVEKKEDITPKIQEMLFYPRNNANEIKEFIYNQAYLIDGKSSHRIANLIRHLTNCNSNENSNK